MKPRANYKFVQRMKGHYFGVFCRCVREHWTIDRYIERRHNEKPAIPPQGLTSADYAEIRGYESAMFDAINGGPLLEWRLGYVNVATATARWDYANGVPTHGGHFWAGSDDLFGGWYAMDQEGPVQVGRDTVELAHERTATP